jgi:cytochrome c oxidase subunit 2
MQTLGIINEMIGLPEVASEHGSMVDHMLEMVHWLVAVLLVGWSAFFVYCLVRFRTKRNPKASYKGVEGHASHHVEIAVVVVEAILLLGFAFPLWAQRITDYPSGPDVVRVRAVGQQFGWNMHYPGPDNKFGLTKSELMSGANPVGIDFEDLNAQDDFTDIELRLPVDRECIVSVTSKDVIHNLSLHPMRIQQDAIPGSVSDMWFKPISTGRWVTICGQLCGSGHSGMSGYMEVMEQEDFDAWYKQMGDESQDGRLKAAELKARENKVPEKEPDAEKSDKAS